MTPQIKIENLSKSFNGSLVLEGVNLTINKGDSIAILGGSGSGKSVLIKCLAGLMKPDPGSKITIDGVECHNQLISDRLEVTREKIGMLFQSNALFDSMTVAENISFGVFHKIAKHGFISSSQRSELRLIAEQNLEIVGLSSDNLDKYPFELSGGMQKRVAIARLISTKPEIILLDEPTTGLDPVTSFNICRLIADINQEINSTIISITHDPICTSELADRAALIENHTITWQGSMREIESCTSDYADAFKVLLKTVKKA